MLSRDTPAYVYLLLLYFDLQQIRHFIIFYLYSPQNSAYLTNVESIPLWYFVSQFFDADKYIYNLPKASITNTQQTLKDGAL